jgi:hypothetical protein
MAKTQSAEKTGSDVVIAGKTYRLHEAGGSAPALPKGAGCSKTARLTAERSTAGRAAVAKALDR